MKNQGKPEMQKWDQLPEDAFIPVGIANIVKWVLPDEDIKPQKINPIKRVLIHENDVDLKFKDFPDQDDQELKDYEAKLNQELINNLLIPDQEDQKLKDYEVKLNQEFINNLLFDEEEEIREKEEQDNKINQEFIKILMQEDLADQEEIDQEEIDQEEIDQEEIEEIEEKPIIIEKNVPANQFRAKLRRLRDQPQYQPAVIEKPKKNLKPYNYFNDQDLPDLENIKWNNPPKLDKVRWKEEPVEKDKLMINPFHWFNPQEIDQNDFQIQQNLPIEDENDFKLDNIDIAAQQQALKFIEKQQEQAREQIEKNRLLKIIQGDDKKEKDDGNDLLFSDWGEIFSLNKSQEIISTFFNMFDQKEEIKSTELPKLYKTGFGMYYIRWCLNNPGFEFSDQQNNLSMNKIDYFKKWIWDLLPIKNKLRWLTRAFNKNNNIYDSDEELELQKIEEARNQFKNLPANKPPNWVNPIDGKCDCNRCYKNYRYKYLKLHEFQQKIYSKRVGK